ncbi:Outer membrane protein [Candidatus Rhodobacter oscarellae]|uniref:Outer membrane protein n=1 Tax=Candidatus Rhodobacter oscarellae TaxID=1675527 RepID=A0A0J9ECU4_9RHOB|nr:OmpA family protein [Candidatus Rhodobacter lobularis]KMW60501.1 Outer membrane protein [Candidatus Rhodobacter lobularis]
MFFTRMTVLAAVSALALSACTSTDVQTSDPNQRTKEGAAVGAVIGGVLGALTGDDGGERRRGALAGAVVGGLVGAGVGYNLDQQAAELQRDLSDGRIQIINNGDHLIVRMPDDILFDIDSAAVKPGLRSDLAVLADSLQRYPDSTVQVVGHTDNTGGAAYNQDLSERRAASVSSILIGSGVPAGRINSFGLGENQPIGSNLTVEGRAQNRRVDISIRPNQ